MSPLLSTYLLYEQSTQQLGGMTWQASSLVLSLVYSCSSDQLELLRFCSLILARVDTGTMVDDTNYEFVIDLDTLVGFSTRFD